MKEQITDFQELIRRWPSKAAFGRDVSGEPHHGRIFFRRNRVPRRHWARLVIGAHHLGLAFVDEDFLDRLYDAGRGEGR